jgi:predicted ester cyclase
MTDSPITIRRALPSDADFLACMGRQLFSDSFAADNISENMAASSRQAACQGYQTVWLGDLAAQPAREYKTQELFWSACIPVQCC